MFANIVDLYSKFTTAIVYKIILLYRNCLTCVLEVGLSLLCSKFYLLFLPEHPKILTNYSYFMPTSSPIIPTYSCNFYCIGDNNVHNTHSDYYTGADFSSESTYMKYCYLHEHLHHPSSF